MSNDNQGKGVLELIGDSNICIVRYPSFYTRQQYRNLMMKALFGILSPRSKDMRRFITKAVKSTK